MNISTYLRTEARPFTWDCLTDPQKDAVEKVAGMLNQARKLLVSNAGNSGSPLDVARVTRVGFIDGDRGMGKTSVLVTLQRAMADKGDNFLCDTKRSEIEELLRKKNQFQWLETLDMEPLPANANLLAAILVRLESLIGDHGEDVFIDSHSRISLSDAFCRLEQSALLSWQGSSPSRISSQDPTFAAQEVLTAERAALEFNERLGEVLEAAARGLAKHGHEPHIFVLPIDDFDLAPTRCLELLRIIRMVTTPRLFFLVAGNTRLARKMLQLQVEGDLGDVARKMTGDSTGTRIRHSAIEISANHLRKLIPPSHRVPLQTLGPDQALDMRLSGAGDMWVENNLGTLRGVFEQIVLHVNYSKAKEKGISFLKQIHPEVLEYPSAAWLSGTPRQTADRIELFSNFREINEGNREEFIRVLIDEMRADLEEDHRSEPILQDAIEALLRDRQSQVRLDFRRHFTLGLRTNHFSGTNYSSHRGAGVVNINLPTDFVWQTRSEQGVSDTDVFASSALTLLHDVAISLWGAFVTPNSILYSNTRVFSPASFSFGALAFDWKLPEWWSIREIARFSSHLGLALTMPTKDFVEVGSERYVNSLDHIILLWMDSCLEILGYPTKMNKSRRQDFSAELQPDVLNRFQDLAREKSTRTYPMKFARRYLVDSALVNLTLMLAPESGASSHLAEQMLKGPLVELPPRLHFQVLSSRLERLIWSIRATPKNGHEMVQELIDSHHAFNERFNIPSEYIFEQADNTTTPEEHRPAIN